MTDGLLERFRFKARRARLKGSGGCVSAERLQVVPDHCRCGLHIVALSVPCSLRRRECDSDLRPLGGHCYQQAPVCCQAEAACVTSPQLGCGTSPLLQLRHLPYGSRLSPSLTTASASKGGRRHHGWNCLSLSSPRFLYRCTARAHCCDRGGARGVSSARRRRRWRRR